MTKSDSTDGNPKITFGGVESVCRLCEFEGYWGILPEIVTEVACGERLLFQEERYTGGTGTLSDVGVCLSGCLSRNVGQFCQGPVQNPGVYNLYCINSIQEPWGRFLASRQRLADRRFTGRAAARRTCGLSK